MSYVSPQKDGVLNTATARMFRTAVKTHSLALHPWRVSHIGLCMHSLEESWWKRMACSRYHTDPHRCVYSLRSTRCFFRPSFDHRPSPLTLPHSTSERSPRFPRAPWTSSFAPNIWKTWRSWTPRTSYLGRMGDVGDVGEWATGRPAGDRWSERPLRSGEIKSPRMATKTEIPIYD